jgi:hypothetical protein
MNTEKNWVIWSEEHGAWWAPDRHSYTRSLNRAGRYSRQEATLICEQANKYCAAGIWNECCLPDPVELRTARGASQAFTGRSLEQKRAEEKMRETP